MNVTERAGSSADLTDGSHGDGFPEALHKLVPLRASLLGQRWRESHVQPARIPQISRAESIEETCVRSAFVS